MSKVLVIAPHPDDEVLGCGGTIKKRIKSGDEVYLCVVTKPVVPDWSEEYIKNKDEEIKISNKFFGFKKTFFLDLPAIRLDTFPQKDLNDRLEKVCREINPEELYIPFFGDINRDHQIVSRAAIIASRPAPGFVIKKVLAYEVSPSTEQGMLTPGKPEDVFVPNYYEDISDHLEEKKKAMEFYKSELKEFPHPRSLKGIEVLAQKRGTECGFMAAEAFVLLREIKP